MTEEYKGPYADIIDLPRHVSKTRKSMDIADRAAQFAPFAALTGHDEAISETARLTDAKPELSEEDRMWLDIRLHEVLMPEHEGDTVSVTYFVPDGKKAGGRLESLEGQVRRVDEAQRVMYLKGGIEVSVDDILEIRFVGDKKIGRTCDI